MTTLPFDYPGWKVPPGFVIQRDVLARGWTVKLIKRFLGERDSLHHAPNGAVLNLYALSRIEAAEATEEWKRAAARVAARRRARRNITLAPPHRQW